MAIVANTFQSTSAVGNREQLSDVVSRITPEDTPIYSMIGKGKTMGVHPEWETDTLAAPGANVQYGRGDPTIKRWAPPCPTNVRDGCSADNRVNRPAWG